MWSGRGSSAGQHQDQNDRDEDPEQETGRIGQADPASAEARGLCLIRLQYEQTFIHRAADYT